LHLVALALQERHDVADFVAQFTGSQRFIIEYLLEEVLNALPQHLRTFVLQISVLDRFCASLCDAVVLDEHSSHVPYSQVLIDEISRVNLFVIPLDDVGRWYRFHHLFADVLRARLQQGISPEQIVLLHRRSSQWHAEHGLFEQAIRHSLAANDVEQAIIILEQQVEGLITRGEVHSLMSWLALIPPESVKTRPDLLLAAAGVSLMHGNFAGMEEQLQQAERLLANSRTSVDTEDVVQGADRGWSTQGVETLRSLLARVQGDMPQAISLGRAALERLPKRFHFLRSTAAWNLGIAYWMSGDTNAAARVLHTLISDNQAPEHVHEYGVTVSSLGQMFALHGKLHEAERLYRRFLDHVAAIKVHVAAVGMVYIGLGDVLRERNDLDAATHYLTAGIELGRRFAGADVLVSGYVALVRVEQARGSTNSIREALAHVQLLAPGALFELTGPQYVRLWLAVGDVDAAAQWAARSGLQCNDVIEPAEEAVYVLFARVLLMQQDLPAAIHLLERLVESTVAGERYGLAIEGSVLLSLAYAQVGKKREALDMLQRALSYAEPEGYVRVFVDEGPPMTALLREAHARNIHPAYCGRLLAAFFDVKHPSLPPASTQPPHPRAATLVEPLNERELEILRLIAQGHSNQHIAGRLVLALSTVKWHVSNLYGKLGVGTRTQALARAAELELL
jgi:LuxR family maltose regulon positive regulatory protein